MICRRSAAYMVISMGPRQDCGTPVVRLRFCRGLLKNTKRRTAHTIVSWPKPTQWVKVHTSDLMMIIRQSMYIYILIYLYLWSSLRAIWYEPFTKLFHQHQTWKHRLLWSIMLDTALRSIMAGILAFRSFMFSKISDGTCRSAASALWNRIQADWPGGGGCALSIWPHNQLIH